MPETEATPNVADLFHRYALCRAFDTQVDDHIRITALEALADNIHVGDIRVVEYVGEDVIVVYPGIALFPARGDYWELAA